MGKDEIIKAKFEMSLWWRIRAACKVWWSIVVTKELECVDDEDDLAHKGEDILFPLSHRRINDRSSHKS